RVLKDAVRGQVVAPRGRRAGIGRAVPRMGAGKFTARPRAIPIVSMKRSAPGRVGRGQRGMMAFEFFNRGRKPEAPAGRLPPGQYLTKGWPVLNYGDVPKVRLSDWRFRVWGLVEEPREWTYDEFLALGHTRVEADVHCVTRWSKLDNEFEGVGLKTVAGLARPK